MKTKIKGGIWTILLEIGWELARSYGPKIWKNIKAYWDRKSVAILGITGCGKDSLLARLQGHEIPTVHMNTTDPERRSSFQIEYSDGLGDTICFNVTEGMNVGGEDDDVDDYWADVAQDADVIFYLVDTGRFLDEINHIPTKLNSMDERELRKASPSLKRVSQDMRFLVANKKQSARLAIILNKIDLPLMHAEGDTIDEKMQHYSQDLQKLKNAVAKIAERDLGVHRNILAGVFPLSCKDSEIFAQLFPVILRNIAKV